MNKIDLGALSARMRELEPEVTAAYKHVDAEWASVVKTLEGLSIPCKVGYTYWYDEMDHVSDHCDYNALEWRKHNGKKRLCLTEYTAIGPDHDDRYSEAVTPFEEWSMEQKVQFLRSVPKFFEMATKQVEQFLKRALEASEK
ncbi:hypothetical protein Q31b_31570 [Novipirellula aureliae]|uniref:Uncharacterized protein n=1 Tax=Novipirellula aureliae TaxID=2527966 RepID=A0A5C6DT35_9BACT|nr:hypothetical protein [Novipirellula aureliae]TWU39842.1 hypothetical protein Q31b_31570 [Novipirellula aureliae]